MLQKLKKREQSGFTIIETLIVLAIAGLILLIVFLAVPGLQRSSRNTQRKNDISAIAAAIANEIDNNQGGIPLGVAADTTNASTTLDICANGGSGQGGGAACTTGDVETAELGYYTTGNIYLVSDETTVPTAAAAAGGATAVSTETVLIDTEVACPVTADAATAPSSPRSAAIFYAIETGSGNGSLQCEEQ